MRTTFVCNKEDFQECLIETELKGGTFKGYVVPLNTTVYHGTACSVSDVMILQRSNFFAERETAELYKRKREKDSGCGTIHAFQFKKSAKLIRMDLCHNVRGLIKLAQKLKRHDVVASIKIAFNCEEDGNVTMPLRYSQNSQIDLTVAKFITKIGFDGFATKQQRALRLASWNRILARGKQLTKDAFFHAEIYLANPRKYLVVLKQQQQQQRRGRKRKRSDDE